LRWFGRLLLLVGFVLALSVRARAASFHPDFERALAELDGARGAEAYAALRRVWETWSRADPEHVEEALIGASTRANLTPAVRAYAATLAAYARLRRGDLAAARNGIRSLGYVDRWLVVGPFDNEGKAGLAATHGPEADLTQALSVTKAYTGKERPVRWRAAPNVFPYGFLSLGALVRPEAKVCAVAATFVSANAPSAAKPRAIAAWVGSGGAFRLFWNGVEKLSSDVYSPHDFDRYAVELELAPGANLLAVKVCGDEAAPTISVRLSDPRGAPDPGLVITNDVAQSEAAAALAQKLAANAAKTKAKPPAAKLLGPVQTFERLTAKENASAAELEAYAQYLRRTDGEDPAQHKARDLARRAAEREPTVERLLLAGQLAEDRNQAGEWIGKAERLVAKAGRTNRDVLLARAWHRRHSPNFREALPLFDRVLELEPNNVDALRGRLELYNLAGLPRTALATIEQAVEQNPSSVTLLALYAAQLRSLGRTAHAAEVEARYHGMRFDDASYVAEKLELSLARQDRATAERWAERLLAIDPHDTWALAASARAYRRLAQPERAIALYRQARELAPEDVGTLRTLADLHAELGQQGEQTALLREILRVRPQDREVRQYLESLEPEKPRPDEAYAWAPDKFLYLRHAPPAGQNRRTLRDLTVSTVFENGLSSKFRQIVFQPLTDAAAAQDRQYAFSYEASTQGVQLRGAKVYRKNGKVDEAIEWGEGPADDPTIAMYTSARAFYIQFPRLEAGDVVELRYRVDDFTPRNEFADYFGEIVYMQGLEETANAEYVLLTPKSRKVLFDAQVPGLTHQQSETAQQRIHRFFAKSVAPVKQEPQMPPLPEVLGFVHVSTYERWSDLGRWYWGLVRDQFDLDDETRTLARKIAEGKKTELEKVQAVYDWVIENTRYVALEFGIYGFKPRRCVQTVARGWGDCKDKATVIVTLLSELGIPSTIVIVRTQMRGGFRSKLPSLAPFDHAIAYVPSLNLYLDGTAEHTAVDELPRMDLGALGLLVNEGDAKIVKLPEADPEKNFVRRQVTARLARTGEAKLDLVYTTGGYVSAEWRRRYHAQATLRDRVNSDLGSEYPGFEIAPAGQGIVTSDLNDATKRVRIQVKGTAPTFARREDGELSMSVTASLRLTPTFASLSSRTQDVLTQGFSTTDDVVTVELPPGAEVVSAPVPKSGVSPFGSYSVETALEGSKLTVKSRVSVSVSRITPAQYPDWKRFCEDVDRALSPRLVVRP
jgi:tetratricopeptide (TPR) repeat protein